LLIPGQDITVVLNGCIFSNLIVKSTFVSCLFDALNLSANCKALNCVPVGLSIVMNVFNPKSLLGEEFEINHQYQVLYFGKSYATNRPNRSSQHCLFSD